MPSSEHDQRPPDDAERESIEAGAAAWLARRDRGLTDEERCEFVRWASADPRHSAALDELASVWRELDALAGSEADVTPIPARNKSALWLAWLGAAAAVVVVALGLWFILPAQKSQTVRAENYATAVGEQRTLALADGSSVVLNTDSAVSVSLSSGERRVRLTRGEAWFTVAKDASRPFIVATNGFAVRALGTAFSVRSELAELRVLVTEGRVGVGPENRAGNTDALATVDAGHRAIVANGAAPVVTLVTSDDIARALAWRDGMLEFDETPLAVVAAEFNRYNKHQLVLGDDATRAIAVGGVFRATDLGALVRVLKSGFHVTAEPRDSTTTVLRKAAHAP